MSEKKRFVQSKYANHLQDIKTDTHYYLTSEKIGCKDLFDEIERLTEENEQLKEQVQILNECCRFKSSDEAIKQAYADLNRREREKHSQGNVTYTAKINQNEVIY